MVFMDVRMPSVDGLSATKIIRAEEAKLGLPRLPIVALTATASGEDRARCIEAGMDDCLPKPFRENELALTLQKWLRPVRPPAVSAADCPAL
jgi:CheY-like chemotaxis protein